MYPGQDKESCKRAVFHHLQAKTRRQIPWGTLVGVRPSKIAAAQLAAGKSPQEAVNHYLATYLVAPDKARLAVDIARREAALLASFPKDRIGVYIDMPFCPSRCSYCSFLSYPAANGELMARYHRALLRDMEATGQMLKELGLKPGYLYFGGGTPTAPQAGEFRQILASIRKHFMEGYDITEFTLEAGRPDTITEEKLLIMRQAGVSRISINPQTFSDYTLRSLGRTHTAGDIQDCFRLARRLGFSNINMDFIFGLPGETVSDVARSMEMACALSPENITIHGLALKKGSRLAEGKELSPDQVPGMYEAAYAILEREGYQPYYLYRNKNTLANMENVGFTKPGYACRYNMAMMEETDTIAAVGASGVTRVVTAERDEQGRAILTRHMAYKDIQLYLGELEESLSRKAQLLSQAREASPKT